ncbi:50S ribosomal protein L22 [Candidatus Parcubacteria bacterium]|nr:50S ribosomal protein L22 [Candidatus Parcubacteria bacterium]
MKVRAELNYLRLSPRKVRAVAELLRGRRVVDARAQLLFLLRRSAEPIRKLLESAVANAKHTFGLEESNLMVSEITVDAGATLKRFRPRSRGLTHPLGRRTSHVTLVLTERAAAEERRPVVTTAAVASVPADREQHRESEREGKKGLREAAKVRPAPRRRMTEFGRRVFRRKAM